MILGAKAVSLVLGLLASVAVLKLALDLGGVWPESTSDAI